MRIEHEFHGDSRPELSETNMLLTYEEAAKRLTISEKTLRRYVREKNIRHRKIGRFVRFTSDDIDSFIEKSARGE